MTIEIVSFPINSMVIFHSYVSLPEGTSHLVRGQNTNIQKLGISDIQLFFSDGTIYLRKKGKHPWVWMVETINHLSGLQCDGEYHLPLVVNCTITCFARNDHKCDLNSFIVFQLYLRWLFEMTMYCFVLAFSPPTFLTLYKISLIFSDTPLVQGGVPPVISWFATPIKYRYISHKPQLLCYWTYKPT